MFCQISIKLCERILKSLFGIVEINLLVSNGMDSDLN